MKGAIDASSRLVLRFHQPLPAPAAPTAAVGRVQDRVHPVNVQQDAIAALEQSHQATRRTIFEWIAGSQQRSIIQTADSVGITPGTFSYWLFGHNCSETLATVKAWCSRKAQVQSNEQAAGADLTLVEEPDAEVPALELPPPTPPRGSNSMEIGKTKSGAEASGLAGRGDGAEGAGIAGITGSLGGLGLTGRGEGTGAGGARGVPPCPDSMPRNTLPGFKTPPPMRPSSAGTGGVVGVGPQSTLLTKRKKARSRTVEQTSPYQNSPDQKKGKCDD
jgi:hypothetical protein